MENLWAKIILSIFGGWVYVFVMIAEINAFDDEDAWGVVRFIGAALILIMVQSIIWLAWS
jgi:FtsH-binding integral membrane protein